MVAHLVRLKLTLLGNGLRRSAWQIVGLVVGLLYALGAVLGCLVGLVALSFAGAPLRSDVLVVAGALLVLGWWVVPLLAFGADASLDPDRFALFPVPRRDLLLGLAVATLVGVPGAATAVLATGSALSWWSSPLALVVGLVGAVLGVATCVLGSRALTTSLSHLVGGRRFRELMAVLVLVPVFLLGPILNAVGTGLEGAADTLPDAATVLGWTPVGAPWALAGDVAAGRWAEAGARLALSLATVALLALVWHRALGVALERPRRVSTSRVRTRGTGAFALLPATPTGAIAARALTYWVRDPRYAAAVVIVPLLPVLAWFAGGDRGGGLMLAVGPVTAYLLGWAISADIAYDSTAFWTHVAAPVRGLDDRAGRVVAAVVVGVPTTLVMTVASLALAGRWDTALPVVALALGVLMTSLAVSSVASAQVVYPVPKPGDNPFSSPQGGSGAAMLVQFVGSLVLGVLLLPGVGLTIAAIATGTPALAVAAVAVSLGLGVVLLVVGVRVGAAAYDRRAPDLLARLVAMR